MDKQRILITGGTGFVGRYLVRELAKEYHNLSVLVRMQSDVRFLRDLGVKLRYGDLNDVRSLKAAVQEADIVIHLAALMSDKEHLGYKEFHRINVRGTQNLLSACSSKQEQFIYISTVGVYGGTAREGADESCPYGRSLSKYERSKAEAEKLVLRFCPQNKLPFTILRIGQLYGPDMRYGWPQVMETIEKGDMRICGKGEALLQLTHVQDAVEGIILSVFRDKAYNQIFNICAGKAYPVKEIFYTFAARLGRNELKTLPLWPVVLLAGLLKIIPYNLRPNRIKYLDIHRLSFFRFHHSYSIRKARELLGYGPKIGLADGVSGMVSWYRQGKRGN